MIRTPMTAFMSAAASGNSSFFAVTTSTSASPISIVPAPKVQKADQPPPMPDKVEAAVYAHIQALRALGKNEVNVRSISRALGIDEAAVLSAVEALTRRGVKIK